MFVPLHMIANMRILLLIVGLTLGFSLLANDLKNGLRGEWICTKVTNEAGELTAGRYARSGIFVGFTFEKGKLFISGSPIDKKEHEVIVQYREDHLEMLSSYGLPIGELKLFPKREGDGWILEATNIVFGKVFYHLQRRYSRSVKPVDEVIELGLIRLIKVNTEFAFTEHINFYYQALDTVFVDRPIPAFKIANYNSFGLYLSEMFDFPKSLTSGIITKDLIVDFKVTSKGMEDIHFQTQLAPEITGGMLKLLVKTSRKWHPAKFEDRVFAGAYRLRFQFGSVQNEQDVLYFLGDE